MAGALAAWHLAFLVSFLPFLRPVLPTLRVASFARTHIMACDSNLSNERAGRRVCLELDANLTFAFLPRVQHVRALRGTSCEPYVQHVAHSFPTRKKGGRNPGGEEPGMLGVRAWIRRSAGEVLAGSGVREGGRFPSAWVFGRRWIPWGWGWFLPLSIGRDPVPSGPSSVSFSNRKGSRLVRWKKKEEALHVDPTLKHDDKHVHVRGERWKPRPQCVDARGLVRQWERLREDGRKGRDARCTNADLCEPLPKMRNRTTKTGTKRNRTR